MKFIKGEVYHIYNRGNNSQTIFFGEENYHYFLKKIRTELLPFCDILAYCLMPNHFHIMIFVNWVELELSPPASATPSSNQSNNTQISNSFDELRVVTKSKTLNSAIAILLRSYTRAIQKQHGFTGSLFQQKTKAKLLDNQTEQA